MVDTRETLEQIQVFLKKEPPDVQKALRLVKNLFIQGICARELDDLRNASMTLLERLVRPIFAGDQASQARIGRLIRQIRSDPVFNREGIAPHLEALAPGMVGKKAQVHVADTLPSFPAKLLQVALMTLGGNDLEAIFPPEKEPNWEQMYLQLGAIIHRQRRSRSNWQREHRQLQTLLAETTRTLAEALHLVGAENKDVVLLADRLASDAPLSDFVPVRDSLAQAVERFQARTRDLHARLSESREAEEQFRVLLRRAEWELLDVRDEKLQDSFTGLPNRFALLAYIERAMQFHQDGAAGFTLIMVLLDDYAGIVRDLGRNRVNRLMRSVAERLASGIRPRDYLARFNDETFALICPSTGEAEAIVLATQLRDLLDYSRFEIQDAVLSVHVAFGVVRHEKGEGMESLLGLGLMAAKEALEQEALRIRSVPPRQKPPSPPPEPRKKLFGF